MARRALLVAALLVLSCGPRRPLSFTALTFNVLCSFCDPQNFDPWSDRLAAFKDILARHDPDVFGLQELFTTDEVKQIQARAPGYAAIYFHDPARNYLIDYPDATLFYRESLFELVESGTYWLSATPEQAWSFGWADAQVWRLVTWARLRHKPTGHVIYAATTHVDNNHPNQDMSAPVLLQYSAARAATEPVLLMGDFNSTPDTTAYQALVHGAAGFAFVDAYAAAAQHEELSNQAPAPAYDPAERIDHVFLGGPSPWHVDRWRVDLFVYGTQSRPPSDHRAISVQLWL